MKEEVALIFIRQKAARNLAREESTRGAEDEQHYKRDSALSNERTGPADILVCGHSEPAIEPVEELRQQSPPVRLGTEQQRGERRAEGQRVKRRKDYRYRDRDRELLIEPSGNPGDEGRRNEYGGQHEGDPDNWPGDFLHRFERCIFRC